MQLLSIILVHHFTPHVMRMCVRMRMRMCMIVHEHACVCTWVGGSVGRSGGVSVCLCVCVSVCLFGRDSAKFGYALDRDSIQKWDRTGLDRILLLPLRRDSVQSLNETLL